MTATASVEQRSWRLLRAGLRLSARHQHGALRRLGQRLVDRGASDWHRWAKAPEAPAWLRQRAARRVALGGVLRALGGATLAASQEGAWVVGREAADYQLALWRAHQLRGGW